MDFLTYDNARTMLPISPFFRALAELHNSANGLTPQAKYLFVRMVYVFGNTPSRDTRQQLAAKMGMSVEALTKAQGELVRKGLATFAQAHSFSRQTLGVTTQGRFRRGFQLTRDALTANASRAVPLQPHPAGRVLEVLHHLLLWQAPVEAESARQGSHLKYAVPAVNLRQKRGLTFQERLLMGVLLAHADEFGIVWDVHLATLATLTGMTKAQVRYQLEKLAKAGLILHRVPGLNGQLFFHQSPGAILLNLNERIIPKKGMELRSVRVVAMEARELQALSGFVLRKRPPGHPRDSLPLEKLVMVDEVAARVIASWRGTEEDEIALKRGIDLMNRARVYDPRKEDTAYSQYRLCRYASELWRTGIPSISSRDPLVDRIRAEISKPGEDRIKHLAYVAGAVMLYALAHDLVKQVAARIRSASVPLAIFPGPKGSAKVYLVGYDLDRLVQRTRA